MQITIDGPRGSGKTSIAMQVAFALRKLGCRVNFAGDSWHAMEKAAEVNDALHHQEDANPWPWWLRRLGPFMERFKKPVRIRLPPVRGFSVEIVDL